MATPAVPEMGSHPEEIRSEFDLRIGERTVLQGKIRTTPAGVICAGMSLAMMTFALGYLVRSGSRRRR